MIIKNYDALATTNMRRIALTLIEAGIRSVLPIRLMKPAIKYCDSSHTLIVQGDKFHLDDGRIFVIGGGKAAGSMAEALERIIPPVKIVGGTVNTKSGGYKTKRIKVNIAGHPIPDQKGINGVNEILALKNRYRIDAGDLVICLLSGGASALLPMPVVDISLEDKQQTTDLLLRAGADITEINIVRKHLSQIKGGQLGQFFYPATVISVIISDVIGNQLSVIASGPTCDDLSTFEDVHKVILRYNLQDKISPNVSIYVKKGLKREVAETAKKVINCRNYIIGDNTIALRAMERKAKRMGLYPLIVTTEIHGETTVVSAEIARDILNSKGNGVNVILLGGETTPKLPLNAGMGGRNQHYTAVSLLAMEQINRECTVASIGTDGSDYLPDVAGAIADRNSLRIAYEKKLNIQDYINRYDSKALFENIGNCLIKTGETGTNVGDIVVYVLANEKS